ncbi:hypothetical protein GCM10027589_13360 [Actinocorallia lasiicapitis]
MLFYRAAVDLSRSTLNYVAGLIRRRRKAIGPTWRLLNPGRQAMLVLVHLRKAETFAELGAGYEVSAATAWRYVEETVALLSARSPKLTAALKKAKKDGLTHLILDGTLIHTDRSYFLRQAPRPRAEHPGHRRSRWDDPVDVRGPARQDPRPDRRPHLGTLRKLEKAGILTPANNGYQGAGTSVVITPYKGRKKPDSQKQASETWGQRGLLCRRVRCI